MQNDESDRTQYPRTPEEIEEWMDRVLESMDADDSAAREHLAAGFPIYLCNNEKSP